MKIGMAGTGRMGAAIAQRLAGRGHQVTVWNRTADKARALGLDVADSATRLADVSETLISILTDAAALESVYGQLLAGDVKGKLFIEMSTVRFAGGEAADVARARPLLDQLCRRVEHVGPVGAGAAMKLAINLPLLVFWQAFGEALSLCEPLGLDPARLMDIFADTSGGPNVLKVRGPAIAAALAGKDPGGATFNVDSIRKDLRTMLEEARALGRELPVTQRTLECFDRAARDGLGAADAAMLPASWLRSQAK